MSYTRALRLSVLSTVFVFFFSYAVWEYTPFALRWRAEQAVAAGQTRDAIDLLTRTVAVSPGDTGSHMRLVELYNALLKHDTQPLESPLLPKLLTHLETAAQRSGDVALQERVTRIYGMLGDAAQTRKTALRAAALESENPEFLRMAVVEAIEQGKTPFARNLIERLKASEEHQSFATALVEAQYQQAVYDVVGLKRQLDSALVSASELKDSSLQSLSDADVTALYRLLRAAVELNDPESDTVTRANQALDVMRRIAITRQSTSRLIDAYTSAIGLVNAAHQARPEQASADADLRRNRQWLLSGCQTLVVTLEAAPVPALCEDISGLTMPAKRLEEIAGLRTQVRLSIADWGDADEAATTFWSVQVDDTPEEEDLLRNAG